MTPHEEKIVSAAYRAGMEACLVQIKDQLRALAAKPGAEGDRMLRAREFVSLLADMMEEDLSVGLGNRK